MDTSPRPSSADVTPPTSDASRRGFLVRVSQAFLGIWGLGALSALTAYLRPPDSREEGVAERIVHAGALEDLRVGDGKMVRHGETPFYVVRTAQDKVIALSAVCTHLRCMLNYDKERKQMICPCHNGRFDLAGTVLAGPPPRALPGYTVSIRTGEIYVQL